MSEDVAKLLTRSLESCGQTVQKVVVEFVSETVQSYIDSDNEISIDEAMTILLDSGLSLDEEDMTSLSSLMSLLTLPEPEPEKDVDDELMEGCCAMCEREMKLTFHHLIPKQVHSRYLKKERIPANVASELAAKGIDLLSEFHQLSEFLNRWGIMVCSGCHSAIHRSVRDNAELAEKYNTLELLMSHPAIAGFAQYNSKRAVAKHHRIKR